MMEKIKDLPKPTIAAIGGPCIAGGLEIAMACDIRIASETARIGDGHIKMGLLGPAGGTARLPRLVGVSMAKELIFTGDMVNGTEACRIGLVNHVYPEDEFLNEALELARRITRNPPTALRISKRAIDVGLQMNEHESLHYSVICAEEVTASAEFKERVAQFVKKD
jgi:enoyl-CoA hydratase